MAGSRFNPSRGKLRPLEGGGGFNKFAAGNKRYEFGQTAPNQGPVKDRSGYRKRDAKYDAYQEALRKKARSI